MESGYCESRSRSRVIEKQYRSLTPERVRELIRRPPPSQARLTRTWSVRLQMAKKLDLSPKLKYRRPSFEPGYNLMLKYRPWPDPVKWKINATTSLKLRSSSTRGGEATTTDIRVDVKPTHRSTRYGPSTLVTKPTGMPTYGTTSFAPDAKTTTGRAGVGTTSPTLGTMTTKSPTGFTQGTGAPTTRLTSGTKPTTNSPTASGLTQSPKSSTTKSPTASTTSLTQVTKSLTTRNPTQSTTSLTSGTKPSTRSPTQSTTRLTEGTKSTSPAPSTTSRTQSTKATTKNQTHSTSSSTRTSKPTTKGPTQSKS